ncbi:hypothetical protein ACOMHN_029085 [Nucella lapillus]
MTENRRLVMVKDSTRGSSRYPMARPKKQIPNNVNSQKSPVLQTSTAAVDDDTNDSSLDEEDKNISLTDEDDRESLDHTYQNVHDNIVDRQDRDRHGSTLTDDDTVTGTGEMHNTEQMQRAGLRVVTSPAVETGATPVAEGWLLAVDVTDGATRGQSVSTQQTGMRASLYSHV